MQVEAGSVVQSRRGRVAVLSMANPPVNAFSLAMRSSLYNQLLELRDDPEIEAVVLHGRGRGFSAGGDIKEFGTSMAKSAPGVSRDLHPLMESFKKPLVAAIHGMALGGGLETALACHYRIASSQARIGLPEVRVGVIPLSGTQRLPRLMCLEDASRLILEAEIGAACDFAHTHLFDSIVDVESDLECEAVVERAIAWASDRGSKSVELPLIRNLPIQGGEYSVVLNQMVANHKFTNPAQEVAARALVAAFEAENFDHGIAIARELYDGLIDSPQSLARRQEFLRRPVQG